MNGFQKKYLPLDLPFNQNPYGLNSGISALHDLYPGRPMTIEGRYYEINEIENEDPEEAKNTYLNNKKETKEYANFLQNLALSQGGGDSKKVLMHAVDDPSSVIDNPSLQNTLQTPTIETTGKLISHPTDETATGNKNQSSNESSNQEETLVERFENEEIKDNKRKWSFTDIIPILFILFVIFLLKIF